MGPVGVRPFPGRAPRHGHRPPGEPRVPGEGRLGRRHLAVPGLPRRHRLAHDDDQRPRRARLGRRRHRGRGGDGRPTDRHAVAGGGRLPSHRRAARGRHRHRPRPARDRDAPPARRGGQVRRVLRPGPRLDAGRQPGDDRQHGAGVRDRRLLPRRRSGAPLPAPHGPRRGPDRDGREVLQGTGAVAGRQPPDRLLLRAGARPVDRGAFRRRPASSPGPHPPVDDEVAVAPRPREHLREGAHARRTGRHRRRSQRRPHRRAGAEWRGRGDLRGPDSSWTTARW